MIIYIPFFVIILSLLILWIKEPRFFLFLFYRITFQIRKGKAIPDHKILHFPESIVLEQNWIIIRDEVKKVLNEKNTLPRFHEVDKSNHKISFDTGPAWKTIVLKAYDAWFVENCNMFPNTHKLLKTMPSVATALFSILEPHVQIPSHTGKLSGLFRYHLALEVPEKGSCFIDLNGEKYKWKAGEGILFDDTFLHSVTNDTEEYRIILFLDIIKKSSGFNKAINKLCFGLIKSSPMFKRSLKSGTIQMD